MCSADACKRYGRSWSCPPYCGSIEAQENRMRLFEKGILVQTTGQMKDAFDMDKIRETEALHKRRFDTLIRQMKLLSIGRMMPMGSGACTRCKACTCPEKPCRFPDKLYPSMEACGLQVSQTCEAAGLGYNYGENTITFTACVLLHDDNDQ